MYQMLNLFSMGFSNKKPFAPLRENCLLTTILLNQLYDHKIFASLAILARNKRPQRLGRKSLREGNGVLSQRRKGWKRDWKRFVLT